MPDAEPHDKLKEKRNETTALSLNFMRCCDLEAAKRVSDAGYGVGKC